jgi:hypothetical protein
MVQSKFNLVFWFVIYNIFLLRKKVELTTALSPTLSLSVTAAASSRARCVGPCCSGRTLRPLDLPDERSCGRISDGIADAAAGFFYATCVYRIHITDPVQIVKGAQFSGLKTGHDICEAECRNYQTAGTQVSG